MAPMDDEALATVLYTSGASGQPPAQFLLQLRMKIAAQRLSGGETIERTAEHVGYRSHAAFSRAFLKVIGEQPGAFRRSRRQSDAFVDVRA